MTGPDAQRLGDATPSRRTTTSRINRGAGYFTSNGFARIAGAYIDMCVACSRAGVRAPLATPRALDPAGVAVYTCSHCGTWWGTWWALGTCDRRQLERALGRDFRLAVGEMA